MKRMPLATLEDRLAKVRANMELQLARKKLKRQDALWVSVNLYHQGVHPNDSAQNVRVL